MLKKKTIRFSIMKTLLLNLFFFVTTVSAQSQGNTNSKDASQLLNSSDFSGIFVCKQFRTDDRNQTFNRSEPLGYFGENYQRIFIHFVSVVKNNDKPVEYFVYGKSRLKNNICDFQGALTIEEVSEYTDSEVPEFRRGEISGSYTFHEDQKQKGTGKFVGNFRAYWLLNELGEIEYDAMMISADGYTNNEFEGAWISHSSAITKKCNWGDYRIPDSDELDHGAGEFHANEKYWEYGWHTYMEQFNQDSDPKAIEARKIERTEWWK